MISSIVFYTLMAGGFILLVWLIYTLWTNTDGDDDDWPDMGGSV